MNEKKRVVPHMNIRVDDKLNGDDLMHMSRNLVQEVHNQWLRRAIPWAFVIAAIILVAMVSLVR